MILLENHHSILTDVLQSRLHGDRSDSVSLKIADFDNTYYRISTHSENKAQLQISISLKCWQELSQRYNALELLKTIFKTYLVSTPESGYDITLSLDLDKIAADPSQMEYIIKNVPLLKRHAMAAPFLTAFQAQLNKSSTDLLTINYREGEAMYVQALPDRVTVVFATQFREEADRVYAKVFLQEFVDARRQVSCQNAPSVHYTSKDPPLELKGAPGVPQGENVGYVTFVLFPRHFSDETTRDATISRILMFRDYLHYHIKCSKAYMHSRMRARVESLLKILNRAKPESQSAEKKTASGRTFIRRN